jgi:DNA-binding MarR family transcriptional regulator
MRKGCELGRGYETWTLLLETHATLVETLERELDEIGGLPLSWYDVLAQLSIAPEQGLRMNELADSVLLSKSGVTRLVDRMVRAGLLKRTACATDRRVVYPALTDKGRKLYEKASPIIRRGVEEHFIGRLTDAEAKAMKSALAKVLSALEERPETQERAAS